jgi:hypothetical protein
MSASPSAIPRISGPSLTTSAVSTRTRVLVQLSIAVGALHHVDHILRADRSGWPATGEVTAFTASLIVYPLLFVARARRTTPTMALACVTLVFLLAQGSHTFIEHPADQYGVWARGYSVLPWALGQPNLLHLRSHGMGVAAVVLSVTLSLVLALAMLSAWQDRRAERRSRRASNAIHAANGKQRRVAARLTHLGVSVALGALVYAPDAAAAMLRVGMQWVGFPLMALSGLYLWQGHRLTSALRRRGRPISDLTPIRPEAA